MRLGALPAARCDPRAIRQVWQNLLGNAIKFTRDRNPGVIEVSATDAGEFIRYAVADNGVGFNADYAGKLFVLFQRLHGMDEFEGTGVGLAIVKRFIQKHGGQVEGVGILNQGATFSSVQAAKHFRKLRSTSCSAMTMSSTSCGWKTTPTTPNSPCMR